MKLPRTIATTIDRIAKEAVGKDWGLYAALIDHWTEIVGADYAKQTTPVKITFPRGKKPADQWAGRQTGGTLTVKLPQGLAMAFSHQTGIVIQRINGFFGYPAIERIALAPAYGLTGTEPPLPPPPLTPQEKEDLAATIAEVEDSDLKEVLETLGASILSSKK
ncbi:MAG: DciA family protein, partial [Alphaproteobacteria bacterium]|nr:DciA family protein [Alphaproteobacteria bacterium]